MSARTPGPWHYVTGAVWTTPHGPDDGGQCIATRYSAADFAPSTKDANLRLCAAAPDLLEALDELLEHVEWRRRIAGETAGPRDVTHRARAALAKARGTP